MNAVRSWEWAPHNSLKVKVVVNPDGIDSEPVQNQDQGTSMTDTQSRHPTTETTHPRDDPETRQKAAEACLEGKAVVFGFDVDRRTFESDPGGVGILGVPKGLSCDDTQGLIIGNLVLADGLDEMGVPEGGA